MYVSYIFNINCIHDLKIILVETSLLIFLRSSNCTCIFLRSSGNCDEKSCDFFALRDFFSKPYHSSDPFVSDVTITIGQKLKAWVECNE